MSSGKAITVLLPVYNSGQYILPAIQSILAQTHKTFELLIIDDGSTDTTAEKIFTLNDPRIRYEKIPHGGLGRALNYGLQHASHEIVARMDGDDLALPERLEKQLAVFSNAPANTILSCRYAMFTGDSIWGVVNSPPGHEEIVKRLPLHNELIHIGVMYNRKFIIENGGYWENIFEDYELWLRLKDKANFHIFPEVLVMVRYRNDSLSRMDTKKQYQRVYEIGTEMFGTDASLRAYGLTENELPAIRGWREYFFGDKALARSYWRKAGGALIKNPKMLIAYCMTWLPESAFITFKENRLRFRINYILSFFNRERKALRKVLKSYL